MAVQALNLTEYVFVSAGDTEEPHTEFEMQPMQRMEYFKVSAVYNLLAPEEGQKAEEAFIETFREHADELGDCIYGYIEKRCKSVKNFMVDGKLESGDIAQFLDGINPVLAMEIVGDALIRVRINKAEAKN